MMRKKKLFAPLFLGLAMVITACGGGGPNIHYSDGEIDTPWEEYSVPVSNIKVASNEVTIKKEATYQVKYTLEPKMAANTTLSFISNNENVVTISDTGLITGVGAGQASVTLKAKDERSTAKPVDITVNVEVDTQDFSVSPSSFDSALDYYSGVQFETTFTPSDATNRALTWEVVEDTNDNTQVVGPLATISESGYLTVHGRSGSGKVVVTHKDINKTIEIPFSVANCVTEVSIVEPAKTQLELNETLQLEADLHGAEPQVEGAITFASDNPDVIKVDAESGLVTPLTVGTAHITATCRGVTSEPLTIESFEVFASAISFSKSGTIELQNDGEEQLVVNYTTSNPNYDKPSKNTLTFASSHPEVATVSSSGLVKAIAKGDTVITATAKNEAGQDIQTSINVHVTIVAKSITLSGATSVYIYEDPYFDTIEFTVKTTPEGLSDETVNYALSDPSLVEIVEQDNQHIVLKGLAQGNETITAICGGLSDSKTFSINERPVYFEDSNYYIVGNMDYHTGTSQDNGASWGSPKLAFHFTHETGSRTDDKILEYEGIIHFHAGDEWKIREGSADTGWKNLYEIDSEDPNKKNWHYEQAGSLANGEMTCSNSASGNITVNVEGVYHVYYKEYQSGWFGVYVSSLSINKSHIAIGTDTNTVIKAQFSVGELTATSNNPAVASVLSVTDAADGKDVNIKTGSVGTAIITISDESFTRTCEIVVDENLSGESKTLYVNANGLLDAQGAVPWAYAWNSTAQNPNAYKMSLVSGQEIVYYVDIPQEYDSVIFTRCNPEMTSFNWEGVYNQSKDLEIGNDTLWTMTGYFDIEEGQSSARMNGYWSAFNADKHYTVPADYYLTGTFNSWNTQDENYRISYVSEEYYEIEHVYLEAGAEVQAYHTADGAYLGVSSEYPGCNYTVGGEFGHNAIISSAGDYTVRVYLDELSEQSGNYLTFHKEGGSTPVVDEHDYYLAGGFNDWTWSDTNYKFTKVDEGEYEITGLRLETNGINIKATDDGDETTRVYYGVETAGTGYTVGENGNMVVTSNGVYTVHLSLSAENHLSITKTADIDEGGGDTPVATTVSVTFKCSKDVGMNNALYLVGSFNNWTLNTSSRMSYVTDHWEITIELNVDEEIQFKVAKGGWDNPGEAEWLPGDNLVWTPDSGASEYIIYWN